MLFKVCFEWNTRVMIHIVNTLIKETVGSTQPGMVKVVLLVC